MKKENRYGIDMSIHEAYWIDSSNPHKRNYILKRAYKECGCEKCVDCCCDEDLDEIKPNRRLLLTLRR